MDIKVNLDIEKVQKALGAAEKQMQRLQRRATNRTAVNVRAIVSKGSLGLDGLRRKKVPRARVKSLRGPGPVPGVWIGLNDIRASEFKEKPIEADGGVRFQGEAHEGYFLARFKHDPLPKSVRRAVTLPQGESSWVEIMVPIESKARRFIETEVEPQIEGLFNKNFEAEVNRQSQLKWNRGRQTSAAPRK